MKDAVVCYISFLIAQRELVDKCLTGFSTGIHTVSTIGALGHGPATYAFGVQIKGAGLAAGEWWLV